MYLCELCQNDKQFKEYNLVETEIELNNDGTVAKASDSFVVCEYVVCGQCGASSEDGHILHRDTREPISGGLT